MAVSSRSRDGGDEGGSGSPEQVAYNLMRDIAHAEKRELRGGPSFADPRISKQWILNTYRECLVTVRSVDAKG